MNYSDRYRLCHSAARKHMEAALIVWKSRHRGGQTQVNHLVCECTEISERVYIHIYVCYMFRAEKNIIWTLWTLSQYAEHVPDKKKLWSLIDTDFCLC